jgi:hypothetical protein
MGSLKSLDLVTGIEQVHSNILVNLQDIEGVSSLIVNGGTNSIDIGDFGSKGTLYIYNDNDENLDIQYSDDSTQNLQLRIKNTKATLEDGDILVFDDTDSTFKVDNISNYVSGGGGNTYTISLPFSKGGGNVDGSVTVPTDAIILNYWLKVDSELSTGGAPFQFQLQGSTPLLLAIQDTDFYETVGMSNIYQKTSGCPTLSEASYKVTSADSGVIRAVHSGSGYGGGIFYLEYSTELS